MEVKIVPMNAIWLVLVNVCHFVLLPPSPYPVGVLVALAMPVKKLSKMAGNSASHAIYSIVGG